MHEVRKTVDPSGLPPRSESSAKIALSPSTTLRDLGDGVHIIVGNAGDHPLVLQLLVQVYQSPVSEDFQSRLDDPGYEPSDRVLLVRSGKVLGHVQISKQIGWFQQQRCAIAKLHDFATLPEFRSARYDESLLQTAEEAAVREGSVLGLVRTDRPDWFRQQGWSTFRGQGHTQANTHSILSHFDAHWANPRRKRSTIEVRAWRHFEADGLRRVYQQISTNMWGSVHRSEHVWQWLLGRKAHDQVLIAVKGEGKLPTTPHAGHSPQIVGYAVIRDSAIVEMFTLPGFPSAQSQLVARACRDAIDRDHRFVSLHTTAADPMHELLVTAGGSWIADTEANGGVWMIKLLSPERWVERLYPVFHQRSQEAGIGTSQQLHFSVSEKPCRFTLTRRSSRLEHHHSADVDVQCDWHTFQDLMLSNLTFPEAEATGQLHSDAPGLLRTVAALFPPKLFWQSPFELLRL